MTALKCAGCPCFLSIEPIVSCSSPPPLRQSPYNCNASLCTPGSFYPTTYPSFSPLTQTSPLGKHPLAAYRCSRSSAAQQPLCRIPNGSGPKQATRRSDTARSKAGIVRYNARYTHPKSAPATHYRSSRRIQSHKSLDESERAFRTRHPRFGT